MSWLKPLRGKESKIESYAEKISCFIRRLLLFVRYQRRAHPGTSRGELFPFVTMNQLYSLMVRYYQIQITNIRLGYLCHHSELLAMPISKPLKFPQSSSNCPSDDTVPHGVLPLVGCLSNRRVVGLLQYCFPAFTEVLRYPLKPATGSAEVDPSP